MAADTTLTLVLPSPAVLAVMTVLMLILSKSVFTSFGLVSGHISQDSLGLLCECSWCAFAQFFWRTISFSYFTWWIRLNLTVRMFLFGSFVLCIILLWKIVFTKIPFVTESTSSFILNWLNKKALLHGNSCALGWYQHGMRGWWSWNPGLDLVSRSRLSRPSTATCLDWHRGRRNRRRLVGSLELTITELRLLDWSPFLVFSSLSLC